MYYRINLLFFICNAVFVACKSNSIRNSHTTMPITRALRLKTIATFHDHCVIPDRAYQISWSQIQIVCQYYHKIQDYDVSDSWFQTTSGKNFKHCRATATGSQHNLCFDTFRYEYWNDFTFDTSNSIFNIFHRDPIRCYYKKNLGRTEAQIRDWYWKQDSCGLHVPSGFSNVPKEVINSKKKPDPLSFYYESCEDKNNLPLKKVIWDNIDIICYHYKEYFKEDVAEMYFRAKDGRGTFYFCHGAADGFSSYCFPEEWDEKIWKKWTFEFGELDSFSSMGIFTPDNIHCYTRKGTMGDINGMKNWFKQWLTRGCTSFHKAGFHDFGENRINGPR